MAVIDIKHGDYLIVGTNEYAIKQVEWWDMVNADTPAFKKLATVACSTKRQVFANSKRETVTNATVNLSGLFCTAFDVISSNLAMRLDLKTLTTLRQTQISNSTGYIILVLEVPE